MSEIRDIWVHAHNMLRSARQMINKDLRPLNLSSAEGNILLHLLTQGQELGQEQLVEQLDISKPAVSRALESLESKRYITRLRNPEDKRAYQVRLTDKALKIGPTVEQIYNHVFELAVQGVSSNELDYLMDLFKRISENFAREQARLGNDQNSA